MSATTEVVRYFLRLGTIGFGGPNAHLAAMHEELVLRREWIEEKRFLEVVGVTNLIPGPNSSEVAIHLGYLRAGLWGGVLAGIAFLVPALLMLLVISWAYFRFGALPFRDDVLAGIQAVALAAILAALWRLRSGVIGGSLRPVLALFGVGLTVAFPSLSPLVILGAGIAAVLVRGPGTEARSVIALPAALLVLGTGPGLSSLAWVFLRTGLLLFGGGLVLVPLLAPEVMGRGWLNERQFLDGIALGQATPGPIVLASVFIGYGVAGVAGAVVATAAIYLPSFLAVLAGTGPFLRRFRERPAVAAFVEGVTAAALGAVIGAAALLSQTALAGWFRAGVFILGLIALLAFRVAVVWTVLGGAALGLAAGAVGLT